MGLQSMVVSQSLYLHEGCNTREHVHLSTIADCDVLFGWMKKKYP